MKLKYIGRHDAVEVDLPDGGGFTVAREEDTPDLPADFAASLLEQDANWKTAGADKPQKPADKTQEDK